MPWFVKIEEGIVDKPTFDRYVPDHLAFVQELIQNGHHAQTGYWKQKGGGMLLFEAESMEQAKEIVARDPLVANCCVHYKLHEWHVVMGDPIGLDHCPSHCSDHCDAAVLLKSGRTNPVATECL